MIMNMTSEQYFEVCAEYVRGLDKKGKLTDEKIDRLQSWYNNYASQCKKRVASK